MSTGTEPGGLTPGGSPAPSADAVRRRDELVILVPVYNDWVALRALAERLDAELAAHGETATLVVIDDASNDRRPAAWFRPTHGLHRLLVVALRRNLGHQRAIAIGLAWVHEHLPGATTVVMDGDGEDDPHDALRLLAACRDARGRACVFAERTRRSESLGFQLGYHAYRLLHRLLTGLPSRVGNFSVVPWPILRRLVVVSETWSHYAAAVVRARLPRVLVPTARARRLAGIPHMRPVPLIVHGLSAIAVFSDLVGVRLLIANAIGATAALALFVAAPGEVLHKLLALLLYLQVLLGLVALFTFVAVGGRQGPAFVPLRDHALFIDAVEEVV